MDLSLVDFIEVRSGGDARRWAEAVWLGFGGEGRAPQSLLSLADGMRNDPSLRLATAVLGGVDAGAFLLAVPETGREAGVYYFAVLPELRRRGVASAMMEEAMRLARSRGKRRVVLQATPAGVPFYRSAGFEPLFEIPLFSTTDDVF